jgi:hypothetical protein
MRYRLSPKTAPYVFIAPYILVFCVWRPIR